MKFKVGDKIRRSHIKGNMYYTITSIVKDYEVKYNVADNQGRANHGSARYIDEHFSLLVPPDEILKNIL